MANFSFSTSLFRIERNRTVASKHLCWASVLLSNDRSKHRAYIDDDGDDDEEEEEREGDDNEKRREEKRKI
jgi:hypothetical protein